MDLTEIELEHLDHKVYSFLSFAWAIISDADINSEVIRWIGEARFTIWGAFRIFFKRQYPGEVELEGKRVHGKYENLNLETEEGQEESKEHDQLISGNIKLQEDAYQHFLVQNTPYIGANIYTCPISAINDGYNDVVVQHESQGRMPLIHYLLQMDSGNLFNKDGTF